MFNWFKKTAVDVKVGAKPDVATIQGGDPITQLAISESEALKIQGYNHLNNGKLEDAAKCFRQAITRNPHYAEAYTNLGLVFQLRGNLSEAIALYRKAVVFKPNLLPAHLNLGICLMSLGQGDAAEDSFRQVITLATEPATAQQHSVALQSLGVIAAQRGDFPQAEILLSRSLELQPDYIDAHNSIGNLFLKIKRLPEAEASYCRVLELHPDCVSALYNMGILLVTAKRFTEAEASYRRALELQPDYVDAHNNLGILLMEAKRQTEAEISFRRALEIQPNFIDAHNNLGILLLKDKRLPEAEASFRSVLELQPDYVEAHTNLGNLLMETNRLTEAEASNRRAVQLKPDHAGAHNNLGILLQQANRLSEAETSFRIALELKPDYVDAHNNLGNLLQQTKRLTEAGASYRHALELMPDYSEAYNNLGSILRDLGKNDQAVASFRRAIEIKPDYADAQSGVIFTLDLAASVDISELHGERKRWDAAHAAPLWGEPAHTNDPAPARRLRVGYVSADFRDHSAARAFGSMLTRYDRARFDVFAYSNLKGKEDKFTELFRQNVTTWRNIVGLSDESVAEMIREDRIDILVDLSGHTAGNRLLIFARKPAPIQITAWGYATGTGMRAMDVFFADPVLVPPQEKQYFTEEVRYLPSFLGTFFTDPFPEVNELPALSDGFITFGSLNRLAKVSAAVYRVWAEVLLAVPRSRLLLKAPELTEAAVRESIIGHFLQAGVAENRIIMRGKTSWHEQMKAYNQVDIALDPFPQGGGVTALEGLMMGVPVVTLRWPTMAGRSSASFMTTLGLPDWIAETREEYVERAIQKANDVQSLALLRQRLRSLFTASVLGDQAAYTLAVEQEYRLLWQEWCASVYVRGKPIPRIR